MCRIRMKVQIIKYVFALLLSGLFLISTSGIMVYFHHCHHKQETFTSIFFDFSELETHPCSGCSEDIPVSCCSSEGCGSHSKDPVHAVCLDACCIESSFLVRYHPDSEPPQQIRNHIRPACLHLPGLMTEAIAAETEVVVSHDFSPPPEKPPVSGRHMVILYGRIQSDLIS